MYKLMLVDDEDEVREGIVATVDFESCGFTLCAQATGAIDAIEKAAQYQPDVVFTDVHMPYMDGMEMISRLQEMYPTMKYIVLSGYDDFIYVKQALQRQVMDYLLKPLSAQGIMKVLRRTREQLDEQNRQRVDLELLQEKVVQNAQKVRRSVILEYLSGSVYGDAHALCAYSQPMDDCIAFPTYLAVLSLERTDENLEVLRRDFDSQPMLLGASVQEVLSEVFKRHQGEFLQYRSQFLMLLPTNAEEALRTCNEAIQSLQHYLHLTATIGISDEIAGYGGLNEGYQTAISVLDKRLIDGQGYVYTPNVSRERRAKRVEMNEWTERVNALCRSASREQVRQFIDELKQHMADEAVNLSERQLILMTLISAALSAAERTGTDVEPVFATLHMDLIMQPSFIASAGVEQLGELIQYIADAVRKEVSTTGSEMIAHAIAYTKKNYADKELSLESVCAAFRVSQTQFSLLFKRETGTSFLQFLLDLRINAAQELLTGSGKKIYQIAEETGFGDASYFSYCFKQRCGLSPKEYRMQGGM